MAIKETVKSILSHKVKDIPLNDDSVLSELGLDSIDLVELTLEIEDCFNIEFTSGEIANLVTIKDLSSLIERKTK